MAKKVALRMCIACREMKPKPELLRVVGTPEGPAVDLTGRAQGRGAYLCLEGSCIEDAVQHRRLAQALKMAVPQGFGETLREAAGARRAIWVKAAEPRIHRIGRKEDEVTDGR